MQKFWTYNGTEYRSEWAVRNAIKTEERKIFGKAPEEGLIEWWANYGVTYREEPDPVPSLEEVKSTMFEELEEKFLKWYEQDAVVTSSLGFVADSDSRAVTDVSGLITVLEATPEESRSTVAFMDHENQPHLLTLDQLKTVQLEIIQNGQAAYQQKWATRTEIESAKDVETLETITIKFEGLDFSHAE